MGRLVQPRIVAFSVAIGENTIRGQVPRVLVLPLPSVGVLCPRSGVTAVVAGCVDLNRRPVDYDLSSRSAVTLSALVHATATRTTRALTGP
jgi:hypothetical protein